MIIGILADAHGNIYGLKRCLDMLDGLGARKNFFLGDAVDYFTKSKEVLDLLRKRKDISCVKGNHEILLLEGGPTGLREKEFYNSDFTKKTLTEDDYRYIKSWGDIIELGFGDFKILMVHASPFSYFEEYVYPDSNFARFRDLEYDMVFMAHTHIPFMRNIGPKTIVNVGSCGFSRSDGRFINCAVLDVGKRSVRLLKTEFPKDSLDSLKPFHQDLYSVLERRKYSRGILNETQ